ncbi:ribonuclease H2 subunit C isoform X2 [Anabrus simplex]|uniref:ribonuclease H2 subunit C isoform X2 n=1 Tax=Anabrus simplex TaxID=316456 RepID=UPI0034DDC22E
MAIHIHRNSDLDKNNSTVHYLPCYIESDGDANVSKYFQRYIDKDKEKENSEIVVKASFRGYPLHGQIITLPHNYQGIVLKEMKKPLTEDAERNFHTTHIFRSLTYWNWDLQPSRNDAFISALDWIDVAEALHAPVEKD